MVEQATLKLDSGEELRVELDRDDLEHDQIVLRRSPRATAPLADRLAVLDEITASATPRPARTTDRLLEADRTRPY
jgi:hypothetical protein